MNETDAAAGPAALAVNPSACIDARSEMAACAKCADVCPEECLKVSGRAIHVDEPACVECGLCAAVCPSSAITLGAYQEGRIGDILEAELSKSENAVLYCRKSALDGHGHFKCLGALTGARMVNLALSGAASITLKGACGECGIYSGKAQIQKAVDAANYTLGKIGASPAVVFEPDAGKSVERKKSAEISSRRGFLAGFARIAVKQAVSKIRIYNIVAAPNGWLAPIQTPSRKRMLNRNVKAAAGEQAVFSESESLFRMVEVAENCSLCNACSAYCPTGALARKDYPDRIAIEFTAALCVKCHGCAGLCPEKAISYAEQFSASAALAETPQTKAERGKSECVSCMKPFVPVEDGQTSCKACMKVDKFQKHLFSMYVSERRSHES
ncbi:MAG: 4Fe-4S binding protein [Nitrospinae bacterium]|nr:4Fe-4S binding protein [Nitrospinota bacterium]